MDYAAIARGFGCHGIRVTDPEAIGGALMEGLQNTSSPTVIDAVVTRDPARMLPAADNRALKVQKGDRPV
jgi:acetolactate synthase-1/2/3 large subunit